MSISHFLFSQSILVPGGEAAAPLSRLGWTLSAIAIVVTLLMTGLIVVALFRRSQTPEPGSAPLSSFATTDKRSRTWIRSGSIITAVILCYTGVVSIRVMLEYAVSMSHPAMTVQLTAHQYWWAVTYPATEGHPEIQEANEIHIPVGSRVKLDLSSKDVIHSLWIPALGGKTDLLPERRTAMWFSADTAGIYRGECALYCGISHANMRLTVVALSKMDYVAWRANEEMIPKVDSAVTRIFQHSGCAACHHLAGQMSGTAGPDLSHFALREMMASGVLPNTPQNLRKWLTDPQSVKPGTLMPNTGLNSADMERLVSYLESLK